MISAQVASATVPSLKRGFLWSLLGSVMSLLGSWGLMLVLVHLGTPEMVGQYGISMALVAPVMAFANLQLRGLQGTDAREQFAFGDYLGLRILSSAAAIAWIGGTIFLSSSSPTIRAVTLFIAVKLIINSLADVFYGLFQQRERLDKIAQATIWTNIANVALFTTAMLMTGNLVMAVVAATVASVGPLILHNVPTAKRLFREGHGWSALRPRWHRHRLWRLFLQALPLAIVSLLISLNSNLPRYFLVNESGTATLGVFVALVSLLVASDTFTTAIAQTVSPRLAKHFVQRDRGQFISLLIRLEAIAIGIGLIGVSLAYFIGPSVVSWIYEPIYGEEREAIVWLAVSAAIGMMARFVANAITAARRLYVQVVNNAVGLGVLAVGCAMWVPAMGIEGAAIAIAATALVRFLLNVLVLGRLIATWPS